MGCVRARKAHVRGLPHESEAFLIVGYCKISPGDGLLACCFWSFTQFLHHHKFSIELVFLVICHATHQSQKLAHLRLARLRGQSLMSIEYHSVADKEI